MSKATTIGCPIIRGEVDAVAVAVLEGEAECVGLRVGRVAVGEEEIVLTVDNVGELCMERVEK